MSKPRDSVQMCLVEEGTVVCIDVVGHDKWGTDMGGKLYVDLECLPWLIEAVQGYLRDGKASQRAFSRDELKVSASGSDYWPRLAIESVRAEDAPHGGLSMQSMRPELGPDLVAQLRAIAAGEPSAGKPNPSRLDWLYRVECPQCGEPAGWTGQTEWIQGDVALLMACPYCANMFGCACGRLQPQLRRRIPEFVPGRERR